MSEEATGPNDEIMTTQIQTLLLGPNLSGVAIMQEGAMIATLVQHHPDHTVYLTLYPPPNEEGIMIGEVQSTTLGEFECGVLEGEGVSEEAVRMYQFATSAAVARTDWNNFIRKKLGWPEEFPINYAGGFVEPPNRKNYN